MSVAAILLAGGLGSRFGSDRPKQLVSLGGRTLLERCVETFAAASGIDLVLVVMEPDHCAEASDLLAQAHDRVQIVPGGPTRAASTRCGLAALDTAVERVLVHDVARALVTTDLISRCLAALDDAVAATPVIDSADTVVEASADGHSLARLLDRSRLRRVQTPQAFHADVLRAAHEAAAADPHEIPTDDCSVIARHLPATEIRLIDGEESNLKITTPADLVVAEQWVATFAAGAGRRV